MSCMCPFIGYRLINNGLDDNWYADFQMKLTAEVATHPITGAVLSKMLLVVPPDHHAGVCVFRPIYVCHFTLPHFRSPLLTSLH
jgi:hypothetical protein